MTETFSLHGCVIALYVAILGLALVADLRSLLIPNRYCIALVLLYPAHVLTAGVPIDWSGAAMLALLLLIAGLLPFAAGVMGGGDLKLMAATSLWMGPAAFLPFLAATAIAGGILAMVMLTPLRFWAAYSVDSIGLADAHGALLGRAIPYGVAIAVAGWLVGAPLLLAAGGLY